MTRTSATTVLNALIDGFRVGRALEDGRMSASQARRAMTENSATSPSDAVAPGVERELVGAAR